MALWIGLRPPRRLGLALSCALVCALGLAAEPGRASCNVIPGIESEFRGARGTLNRPFAIPGDVGQRIFVTLKPNGCDPDSQPSLRFAPFEEDNFVTILFEPPNGA